MRPVFLRAPFLIAAAALLSHCGPAEDPAAAGSTAPDENAIREVIESYTDAFEAGDIDALTSHWSADGVYQTAGGAKLSGREEISGALKKSLAGTQGAKLIISLDSLEATDSDTATGKGMALVYLAGRPPQHSDYTAVFKEEGGTWVLGAITETAHPKAAAPSERNDALKPLAWMTGTWVDQGEDSTVYYHCDWSPDGGSLSRSYAVATDDGIHSAGHEIIFWDEVARSFQSRVYDSTGAIIEAEWTSDDGSGDTWTRVSHATLEGGVKASAVQKIRKIDDKSFGLQLVGQMQDGKRIPDIEEVTVVKVDAED